MKRRKNNAEDKDDGVQSHVEKRCLIQRREERIEKRGSKVATIWQFILENVLQVLFVMCENQTDEKQNALGVYEP